MAVDHMFEDPVAAISEARTLEDHHTSRVVTLVAHLLVMEAKYLSEDDDYGAALFNPDGWESRDVKIGDRTFRVTIEEIV